MRNIGLISIHVVQLTEIFLFLSLTIRSLFEIETSKLNFGPLACSSILRKQNVYGLYAAAIQNDFFLSFLVYMPQVQERNMVKLEKYWKGKKSVQV